MKKIFISYSHKDKTFLTEFLTQLKPLERDGIIDPWTDRRIQPGDNWDDEIKQGLKLQAKEFPHPKAVPAGTK